MSEGPGVDGDQQRRAAWERARRRAAVFGETLPETTSDERDPDAVRERRGPRDGDTWLQEQVPPHHGG